MKNQSSLAPTSLILATLGFFVSTVLLAHLLSTPRPFPDRLTPISESDTIIDNAYYNDFEWASTWHSDHGLASLALLNDVRMPCFAQIWSRHVRSTIRMLRSFWTSVAEEALPRFL
jgi:hypothetical protein